jgi:two-component system, chemotaxis family, protein-glutamate methylesterase/glutaminase
MTRPIRVLVVDDSAFARKVLREILGKSPGIEVVGFARDGLEALEKIAAMEPDVITLDLVMPNLDGVGVLRALPRERAPRVVVVSISDENSRLGVEALQSGAVDIVQKPTALATDRLYELSAELVGKVRAAALARDPRASDAASPEPAPLPRAFAARGRVSVVVIGTSTGGPQALTRLLRSLPRDFPVPIVAALHIPPGYTASLARRIAEGSQISVVEASEGLELRPGLAIIARGGRHLRVERLSRQAFVRFEGASVDGLPCPSVDLLFRSAARQFGAGVLGVVLTGMGDDGLAGAAAIHEAGGMLLTESEASCIIYGMPRCVREAGLSAAEATIDEMGAEILRRL